MKKIDVTDKMLFLINTTEIQSVPFYLVHIGSMVNQHPCLRPNGLYNYQFLYCTDGEGCFNVGDQKYSISKGMGVFMKPNIPHEYYAIKEPWSTFWIIFSGEATSYLTQLNDFDTHKMFFVNSFDKLTYLFNKLFEATERSGLLNTNEVLISLYEFLLEFPSCIGESEKNMDETKSLQLTKTIKYIEDNYQKDISLDELAQVVEISPQHLCRLFKKTYKMRPVEYITQYRLSKAKNLLLSDKNMKLIEIAEKIGYHDLSYFCALFKKNEGVTPSEFRKKK